jgi:hypothetical protein
MTLPWALYQNIYGASLYHMPKIGAEKSLAPSGNLAAWHNIRKGFCSQLGIP